MKAQGLMAAAAAAAAAMLAGCGQGSDDQAATAPANQAASAASKPRPAYCFFKDAETKGWSASTDAQGNVVVKGKAYRSDPRYQAGLSEPEVSGAHAVVRPTINPNSTGYAAPGNWWDVSATIPNSAAVNAVTVECGRKTLAELTVRR
ncbi:MAG: hypothetical protein ACJ8D5_00040 [Sphingomicrobium sp.]